MYKAHYWRCEGDCNKIPPYYGTFFSKHDREPGEHLPFWEKHIADCGGKFIKHGEPVFKYIGKNYSTNKKRSREEVNLAEAILDQRKKRK